AETVLVETVALAHRFMGGEAHAPPLLLLHGLLGSSRNWQSAGRMLAESLRVYALDLRNHGESPHHDQLDYPIMAADVLAWMDTVGLARIHICGHSMGGKVAMYLACRYPERFTSLTVVDIAPRAYPPRWEKEFATMRRMPVTGFTRRSEAEEWLEEEVRDWGFRKFLVSNLERAPEGGFRWMVNLAILQAALPNLFQQIPQDGQRYEGPTLFIRGGNSRFIEDEDMELIRRFFPFFELETIPEAGHNVHFDQPQAFVEALKAHVREAAK
ncbi:MAG TPA: alpha/beta fold hydrolase, partial [Oceanipulchritudo sp.]|nr:alpha/beta fold hydrolase [Oceanipulchritudo sp.]